MVWSSTRDHSSTARVRAKGGMFVEASVCMKAHGKITFFTVLEF
jgi:hypothetical protein